MKFFCIEGRVHKDTALAYGIGLARNKKAARNDREAFWGSV